MRVEPVSESDATPCIVLASGRKVFPENIETVTLLYLLIYASIKEDQLILCPTIACPCTYLKRKPVEPLC